MSAPDPTRPGIVEALTQEPDTEPAAEVGELADGLFETLSQHIDLSDDPKLAMQIGIAVGAHTGRIATQIADAIGADPTQFINAVTGVGC